jgi:PAS domain S-box-containing protein
VTNESLPILDLIDSAPDGFVVVDETGAIVFVNRTAEELFGYTKDELLGLIIGTLIPERFRQSHKRQREAYMRDPRVRPMGLGLDLVGRRKDGSEFPVEISLSPLETPTGRLFTAIVRDVTVRKALEEERNALASELDTERERHRIAMDLHDGIMQDIYAASLALELVEMAEDESTRQEAIERVIDQLHGVVRNIRSYIFDLRPREFSGDLVEAVSNLANEFKQNSQIKTLVEVAPDVHAGMNTSLAVYNIAHECLSNIQKHAHASRVTVALRVDGDAGLLEVTDNGVGFDTEAGHGEGHRGLRNMAARARQIEAELELVSAPRAGTRLSLRFPLDGV